MTVLIVVESLFGNTRALADRMARALTVADGLESVTVMTPTEAPRTIPSRVSLLLVGGPTHGFSMSWPGTRADALRQGASGTPDAEGIREWIDRVIPRPDLPVYTFDTKSTGRLMPGSAASTAARALRNRGFDKAVRGHTFRVGGTSRSLPAGELQAAADWVLDLRQSMARKL